MSQPPLTQPVLPDWLKPLIDQPGVPDPKPAPKQTPKPQPEKEPA